jgi:hypothetical protein
MRQYKFTVTLFLSTLRRRYYTIHKTVRAPTLKSANKRFSKWIAKQYPGVQYVIEGVWRWPGALHVYEGARIRSPQRFEGRGILVKDEKF